MTDLRMRATAAVDLSDTAESVHPFLAKERSLLHTFTKELGSVLTDPQAKKILGLATLNVLCTVLLLLWCNSTNSMALTAYTYLTIFDLFGLLTCLVSIWAEGQETTPIFSFGYDRFEVLSVFASTILAQFGSLFIIKESIERMLLQPTIDISQLLPATSLAFFSHILVTYTMDNRAFNHVILASSSSWLQEHVSDISESICNVMPGVSKLLLPRINPFALIAFAGATALMFVYLLIDIRGFYPADTWAAVWIAMMTCGTMFPMSVYSGKILLQTTPSHIIGQLDKSIREASTLDGVLEFRHEHFWTLAFGTMAGSVHVRVRRDADEQMVLAHVFNRLSNLVIVLTVQIFKDDWSRPSSIHILNSLPTGFTSTSPSASLGTSRAQSPTPEVASVPGNPYHTVQQSSYPFSGIGIPPVLIPSRTDPAIVANFGGPANGNIPALRLAANAPANTSTLHWNKVSDHSGQNMPSANSISGPSVDAGSKTLTAYPGSMVGLGSALRQSSDAANSGSAQARNRQDSSHLEQSVSQIQKDILQKQS